MLHKFSKVIILFDCEAQAKRKNAAGQILLGTTLDHELGHVLGLDTTDHSPEGLVKLGEQIRARVPVNTVVIHPTHYALAVGAAGAAVVEGPFTPKPLITTGAGDHFNAGFCLGKLLGFDNTLSVLTGVTTSGFYVRTAKSPAISDLVDMLRDWPS